MATILKLVPNTGNTLKEVRDGSHISGTLLTALIAGLAQERSPILNRMLENLQLMKRQMDITGKANRHEQDTLNKALQFVESLIAFCDTQ